MVKFVLIRGPPAVGKTTITKRLLKILKVENCLDCAYISEDDFRKQMQFKYKAKDLQAHLNSVDFIKSVILKLIELDSYDLIFIEGLFRYKPVLEKYFEFMAENNFNFILFHFDLSVETLLRRDVELRNSKSKDIQEIKADIDSFIPEQTIFVETKGSLESVLKTVLDKILSFV